METWSIEYLPLFTVTLMAQPGGLETSTVEAVYGAWGGSQLNWLSGGEAAAFALPVLPDNQWQVWADLQKLQIDLVVQASAGRQKKLLLADMDSTMIQQECIDELADVAGVGDRVKGITARAMNGELDFNSALIERVGKPSSAYHRITRPSSLPTRAICVQSGAESTPVSTIPPSGIHH